MAGSGEGAFRPAAKDHSPQTTNNENKIRPGNGELEKAMIGWFMTMAATVLCQGYCEITLIILYMEVLLAAKINLNVALSCPITFPLFIVIRAKE